MRINLILVVREFLRDAPGASAQRAREHAG